MPLQKYFTPFLIALLAVTGMLVYAPHQMSQTTNVPADVPVEAVSNALHISPSASGAGTIAASLTSETSRSAPAVSTISATTTTSNATLKVGDTVYPITALPGETVIIAMRTLSDAGALSFTGRDYPALGFFVDSIDGKKNAGGNYWMLYRNGISETVGATSAAVKAGDTIEWRYEKGY
jgi:hypothetical protein